MLSKFSVDTLNNPWFFNSSGPTQAPIKEVSGLDIEGCLAESEPAVSYGGELKTLLDGFLEIIIKSAGASAGVVRILSPCGRQLHIAGAVGLHADMHESERQVHLGCGVCGKAVREGDVHMTDANACAGLSGSRFFGLRLKRVVAAPLEFRGNRIGVFNLFFDSEQELAGDAARTLRSFGEMIGISLENARLARENRRMNLMAERQAIANEIHDSLAQTLVFSRMRMSVLQEALRKQDPALAEKCVHDVNEALDSGKKSVRELITHFRCQMDPLGLLHALRVLVAEFIERTGIALEYSNHVADPVIPLEHESQVFHIVREVLANIATHSGASHASLQVTRTNGRYVFVIEDNGAGMSGNASPEGHYGLTIMRERAQRIGAEIEVQSARGQGTRVRLSLATS